MNPDITASIRARLLNQARLSHEEFELHLVRYGCERFLYRLGASSHGSHLVLKGAALLTLWMNDPYRATRDLDFLAHGPSDDATIRRLVAAICAVPCPEDGVTFDLHALDVSPIRADEEYQGQRVILRAFLGTARIRLQLDFGFGDAVSPKPEDAVYPTMLRELPAPRLRTYPKVASLAEKFEAMIHLGRRNSRMKDFHDVWALASAFEFDGPLLRRAVVACLERRATPWTEDVPDVLGAPFYADDEIQSRWQSYLRAGAFRTAPPTSFEMIGEQVRQFLGPVRDSVIAKVPFDLRWSAGGPWR